MRIAALAPIVVLFIALSASAARAEDLRDLCAQRPGKATPPCIVDAGHPQIEVGLADAVFLRGAGAHEDIYNLGAAELRLGLTKRLEIEAAWSPLVIDTLRGGARRTGSGDATLALLGALTDPDGKGLAVSAQGFVTLPTASHGLGAGGWTGGVRLPIAMPLSDSIAFGLTPEVDILRNAGGGGVHAAWIGVGAVSHTFGATTLGAELWGEVEDEPTGVIRRASADLTAAVVIGKSLQLDAGANFGLNHATPEAEIYLGVSRRF